MTTHAEPAHGGGHDSHGGDHGHHEPGFLGKYVFSRDHKIIGIQFLFSGLLFMILGGGLAGLIRIQLAYPDATIPLFGNLWQDNAGKMPTHVYTMVVTMHASVMIFFVIIPLLTGAFGNYLIPLQIGYKDMAFPTLNMLSYWFMVPAFGIIACSFFAHGGAAAAGWTSYPTLSVVRAAAPGSGWGQTLWYMSLLCVGVSSMMGSINYITTIVNCRAPGMTLFRMPMTTWSLFITAILQAFALPVLTVALIMGLLDNLQLTGFFVPGDVNTGNWIINNDTRTAAGGQPLLWQHLFWFYSHPAVYIMILPAMGMVSDVISTFARKPLFGYKPMVMAVAAIAGLGFIVWGHHMFMSGMSPVLGTTFMVSTIMIALPSAIKVFNWIFTIWNGNVQFTAAMLNAMSFVAMFIIGGLSGIFMASTPIDIQIHDTYFIVAHIHYVLFGGSLFGFFAGIYFWFPKMFGRMMNEFWGKVHFTLTFIFYNIAFYLMHNIGIMGAPRRYYDLRAWFLDNPVVRDNAAVMDLMNKIISHSVFLLLATQLIFAINFFYSLFRGPKAERNPWKSNSLEWEAPSPPGHNNFDKEIRVHRGPYEYAHPAVPEDYFPQTHPPVEGEAAAAAAAH